jgi:putative restriction endonuclease
LLVHHVPEDVHPACYFEPFKAYNPWFRGESPMPRHSWSHDELVLAFNLYCKTPFGKIHNRNPDVIALARSIGRTPSAVSWKLANFARLDPSLKSRKISGAAHGAEAEREIWLEFNGNWEKLAYESEQLTMRLRDQDVSVLIDTESFPEGRTRETIIRARVNQAFFRSAVLAAYDFRCCITGLASLELLNASHIVPWNVDHKNRTNPRNGLCLNALHDRAFDCGLLTVTTEYSVKISPLLKSKMRNQAMDMFFRAYDDAPLRLPRRFAPEPDFLRYHNAKIFRTT